MAKLLQLHQSHSSAFGQVQENKVLQQKWKETKTKFDQDQKNKEAEFARSGNWRKMNARKQLRIVKLLLSNLFAWQIALFG